MYMYVFEKGPNEIEDFWRKSTAVLSALSSHREGVNKKIKYILFVDSSKKVLPPPNKKFKLSESSKTYDLEKSQFYNKISSFMFQFTPNLIRFENKLSYSITFIISLYIKSHSVCPSERPPIHQRTGKGKKVQDEEEMIKRAVKKEFKI